MVEVIVVIIDNIYVRQVVMLDQVVDSSSWSKGKKCGFQTLTSHPLYLFSTHPPSAIVHRASLFICHHGKQNATNPGERTVEYVLCGLLFRLFFLSSSSSDWLVSNGYVCQRRLFLYLSSAHYRLRWTLLLFHFIYHADVLRLSVLIGHLLSLK